MPEMSINPYPENWHEQTQIEVAALRCQFPDAFVYALIDGALNESFYPLLKHANDLPFIALYEGIANADEETLCMSPLLVEYREAGLATWNSLLRKTEGKPAFSMILTRESLEALTARLRPWCIVDAAGNPFALAFADTRILPELFRVLKPGQLVQLCGPAAHWRYVSRNAEWRTLKLRSGDLPPASSVELDEGQCIQLIEAAEADNVLFHLGMQGASTVIQHSPMRAYELTKRWLGYADETRMEQFSERLSLCELGLMYPGAQSYAELVSMAANPA